MKNFSDLVFKNKFKKDHIEKTANAGMGEFADQLRTAKQATLDFPNGYGVSVITGYGAYGGDKGLYELAVFYSGDLVYPDFMGGDVKGFLEPEEVTALMKKVQELK